MKKKTENVLIGLLRGLTVRWARWHGDGKRAWLSIGLAVGSRTWERLRTIRDKDFQQWAENVRQVSLDTGEGVYTSWDVHSLRGAGFAPIKGEGDEDEWCFSFFVSPPPDWREQSWSPPTRVRFKTTQGGEAIFLAADSERVAIGNI